VRQQYNEHHYRRAPQEALEREMRYTKKIQRKAEREQKFWSDLPGATTPHFNITDKESNG